MAVQAKEVGDVVDLAPEGALVTSFYLDVDAENLPSPDQMMTSFDSLMHQAESDRKDVEQNLSHEAQESIRGDLAKIRDSINDRLERQDTKGIAVFSCSQAGFWEMIRLPYKVHNQVTFAPRAYVAPLALFLSRTKPTAILLTDRQHARIFTMEHGDVREWTDFEDFVPRRTESGGWSQMRYQRHSDHWAKHHVDRAAGLTLELLKHHPFDWLILAADVDAQADLLKDLHPYLKDRVIGMMRVRIDADMGEVLEKARLVRDEAEGKFVEELLSRVQEYAGAGGRGTIGLKETLGALNEQKVHILLVQEGFSQRGSICPSCEMLYDDQLEKCPACGETVRRVDNIVDSAIQKAMENGSSVEVATEFNKLEPVGCIGAILYY